MLQDVEVGLNISSTLLFTILYKLLMVTAEADIGLITSLIYPIMQVILSDHWFFMSMSMTELKLGLRLEFFLQIIVVN